MTNTEIQKKLLAVKSKFLRFEVRRTEPDPFFVIVTNRHGHQLAQIEYSMAWQQFVLMSIPNYDMVDGLPERRNRGYGYFGETRMRGDADVVL